MRSRGIGVAALVAALVAVTLACSKSEPSGKGDVPAPAGPSVPPVSREALAPLVARLDAALDENARRSCPRPVLRGEPVAGKADAALRAIMEPSPALQACYDAVGDAPEDPTEPCAPLAAAVRTAVSFGDACSPYLLGRNPAPASLTPYLRTAKALLTLGDASIDAGRALPGWQLWLDGIRLGQDLGRGGTTWLEAMVAHAGAEILLDHVHARVEDTELKPDEIDGVRRELAILIASEPHPRTHMLADRLYPLLYQVAPPLMPSGWEPPGGWPPDAARPGPADAAEQQQLWIAWQTLERIAAKQAEACPADSDVATCLEGLDALVQRMVDAGKPGMGDLLGLALDPASASSDMIASTLEAMVAPSWSKYLQRQAQRRVALHALSLRLAVRGGAPCPGPDAAVLSVPGLGDALQAEPVGDAVVLSAPALVTRDAPLRWTISCPSS